MVNLTSFTLSHTPPGAVLVGQLLDFFESTPYLKEVKLCSATPTTGVQNRRLVSLACLKSMYIDGGGPPSVLLDHLLIPVGAKLEIEADLLSSLIGEHLPRSLDNLKNFSNFTTIKLHLGRSSPRMKFSGPNVQVNITLRTSGDELALGSLGEFDTSKTEWLEIDGGDLLTGDPLYQALLPMKDLRTLTFSGQRMDPRIFIRALQPTTGSSEAMVCPKLEKLVLEFNFLGGMRCITSVTEMAAARASRGEKLRTIRIIGGHRKANLDMSELRKHVWNVEYCPGARF